MLFSEATGHRVMTTDTASTVGVLSDFVVDPATAKVIALRLKRSQGTGATLHWEDLTSFGPDTVTVASVEAIAEARDRAAELITKPADIVGKQLLTDTGIGLGTVTDIDFNPANGEVVSLLISGGLIDGGRLIGCGSYAVIVKDA